MTIFKKLVYAAFHSKRAPMTEVKRTIYNVFGFIALLGVLLIIGCNIAPREPDYEAIAQYNAGNMYYKGEGTPQDYKQAAYWYGQGGCYRAAQQYLVLHEKELEAKQND